MIEGEFSEPPAPGKPGPKPGQAGRKSKIFTDDKLELMTTNPGKWIILKKPATQNHYSNAVQWVKRNPGFSVVGRHQPENPTDAKITLFAVYNKEELNG